MKLHRLRCLVTWPFKVISSEGDSQFIWSPSSRTALADAELEYPEGHTSRSIYAIFKLVKEGPSSCDLLQEFFSRLVLGHMDYNSLDYSSQCWYIHPIDNRECQVVIGGDYITTETGTGLVHTAPGHGQEDFVTGMKYGLPVLSHVADDGKFTEEAGQFNGLGVLGDGNIVVVKYLDDHLSIIMEESLGLVA